ncbi:MinD/ParA family ATP-binding protein [Variovorax sp. JS1663]|uniref:MinD/ParA family ATP-binding protein n=1 Tax=Variovorax sp. JS1663 TaxID=1851577 RepID=UPI000B6430CF|nr:flagellar biosynthesis protein FlhG [Variovorax sp. JS1663]OUL98323.1 flagellar biosynthesis protein FlhG [Variovorax sp. JS1663]
MMSDQAEGLRRLLAQSRTRMLAIASMGRGMGATTAAMNLAAALALQGREVLLLDEHGTGDGTATAHWGLDPLGTLADVACQRLTLHGAAARSGCGVQVLPAVPRAPTACADPRTLWQGDVILVDAALDGEGRLSGLAQLADDLVLVMQPHAAAITATYAGVKQLHYAYALRQLRFLVNGVAEPRAAQQVADNLAQAGSRYLAVSLLPAGWVRAEPHTHDAQRLARTVVEAFPASPAAADFRRIADEMGHWPWRPGASLGAPQPALQSAPQARRANTAAAC